MVRAKKERRKYSRFDTELKVYFRVTYDIKTRVKFRILHINEEEHISRRYSGLSKNISAEGLCFVSKKKLGKGDMLLLEVDLPNTRVRIQMEGRVKWSKRLKPKYTGLFHTGVKLISVDGKPVSDSICYDNEYKVVWSIVLETVFGGFKEMAKHLNDEKYPERIRSRR